MSGTTKGYISVNKIGVIGSGTNAATPAFRLGPADPRMGVVGLKPVHAINTTEITQNGKEQNHA